MYVITIKNLFLKLCQYYFSITEDVHSHVYSLCLARIIYIKIMAETSALIDLSRHGIVQIHCVYIHIW